VSRFLPEEYKSDGGFSVTGLPILVVSMCAAAVGLGWLASFIGQWFYLILMFPLGIGLCLIGIGLFVGRLTKMRSPALAALLGLVSAVLALVGMHYFNYLRFLPVRQEILVMAPLLDNLPAGVKNAELAEAAAYLKQVRMADSFSAYMNMEARQGVTISHRGKDGFNLGYVGTWIYWGLELVGVAIMATLGLMGGAMAPFCSGCNEWKEVRHLGTLDRKGVNVAAFLSSGEIERLKEHDPAPVGGDLVLTAAVCSSCQGSSPIAVKLEELTKNAKGELVKKELVHLTYPGEALPEFEALFQSQPERTEEI